MNDPSLFIYAAGFLLFWLILGLAGTIIFKVICTDLSDKDIGYNKEDAITFVGGSLWILIPSKEALYIIAASEAGEAVVNTPEAKEVLQDLREVLDAQLEALKGPITTK